jgi:aconitate decarboxylase
VTGLREMFGSHTKSFHPGRAAQNGLMAALLAQGGYTSSEQALEAKRGWANVVGATKTDISESLDKWLGIKEKNEFGLFDVDSNGGRWEILRNSFKPYPCGIVIHPIIDGCSQLHAEMHRDGLKVEDIDSIEAIVHPLVLELTGKRKPKDSLEGKFSVFHGGAVGLIWGKATPSQYEDDIVTNPVVISIRDKINATADKSLRADETKLSVKMNGGKILEKHVEHAIGSLEVPLTRIQLEEKFIDQCSSILGVRVHTASRALWDIEQIDNMAMLAKELLAA